MVSHNVEEILEVPSTKKYILNHHRILFCKIYPNIIYTDFAQLSRALIVTCMMTHFMRRFYRVFCDVEPKRIALAQANAELAAAVEKLRGIQAKITALEATLKKLTDEFESATAEKIRCQEQADSTNRTIK